MTNRAFVLTVACVSCSLLAAPSTLVEPAFVKLIAPLSMTGSYSSIASREYHRITNTDEWNALWTRHQGNRMELNSYQQPVIPEIDFDSFMVVAILNGETWNTRSMTIIESAEIRDELHLRFDGQTYQTASGFDAPPIVTRPEATQEEVAEEVLKRMEQSDRERHANRHNDPNFTRAYCFYLLPRSNNSIVLIENTQGLLNHPPIWTEVHRFEPVNE